MKRNRLKQLVLILGFLMIWGTSNAQQNAMFTQYMFNGMALNPAYAGSHETLSATMLLREQWAGIDGAPSTQTFAIHSPINNSNVALGMQLIRDKITVFNQTGAAITSAYRIQTEKGTLSMGLQIGFTSYKANLKELDVQGTQQYAENFSKFLPNFGAGIYYYTDKYYMGFSAPQLITNDLTNDVGTDPSAEAKQSRHYFLTTGYVFNLSNSVKFKPNALVKMVGGAPIQLDLNANLLFHNALWVGVSWRSMADIDALVEFQLTDQLLLGYAFDFANTTNLRRGTSGSHEIMLNYRIKTKRRRVISPRYF